MTGDNFSAPVIWSRKDICMKKEILLNKIMSYSSFLEENIDKDTLSITIDGDFITVEEITEKYPDIVRIRKHGRHHLNFNEATGYMEEGFSLELYNPDDVYRIINVYINEC